MKKVLFTISVDNHIDLITNSSSELFVLQGDTKETVEKMIESFYPDYLNEYEGLKDINELTNKEIDSFLWWHLGRKDRWSWGNYDYSDPSLYKVIPGFTVDEIYDLSIRSTMKDGDEYELRNNIPEKKRKNKWDSSFVTNKNRKRVIDGLINSLGRFFLYSIDDNPNWEMQEKLMEIGHRYHLG